MEALVLVLIPLIVVVLGYLAYRHPPIVRQILKPLFFVLLAFIVVFMFSRTTRSNAFYRSIEVTYPTLYKEQNIEVIKAQTNIQNNIREKIQAIIKEDKEIDKNVYHYCFAALLVIIVCYGFSILFDSLNKSPIIREEQSYS